MKNAFCILSMLFLLLFQLNGQDEICCNQVQEELSEVTGKLNSIEEKTQQQEINYNEKIKTYEEKP